MSCCLLGAVEVEVEVGAGVEWWAAVRVTEEVFVWGQEVPEVSVLDGQLEGDVHLSFLSQRDDFRKLYNLQRNR